MLLANKVGTEQHECVGRSRNVTHRPALAGRNTSSRGGGGWEG